MFGNAHPEFAGHGGENRACAGSFQPPLPLKLLGVGAAFLICRPLGALVLGVIAFKHFRRHGFPGQGRCNAGPRGPRGFMRSGNSAFDAAQREAVSKLAEDAEAFAAFRRQQREARDKEAFDRFRAERDASSTPKTPES